MTSSKGANGFLVLILGLILSCSDTSPSHSVGASIVGKQIVVNQPLFVLRHAAFSHVLVEPPGHTEHAPPTITLYERHRSDWMNTPEAWRAGVSVEPGEVEVLGVLQPGTIIVVTDFDVTHSFVGDIFAPLGYIENEAYAGLHVEFFCLFEGLGGSDLDPRPIPKYLTLVSD